MCLKPFETRTNQKTENTPPRRRAMEWVTWYTARAKDLVASETKDVEGGEKTRKIHNKKFGTNNFKKYEFNTKSRENLVNKTKNVKITHTHMQSKYNINF